MVVGSTNPNYAIPIAKLCITKYDYKDNPKDSFYVLYNPETIDLSRELAVKSKDAVGGNTEQKQFVGMGAQSLSMELFFDTFSSGLEVGGTLFEKAALGLNSLLPSPAKTDVRKFSDKVYNLMQVDGDMHAPPLVKLEWGSLVFKGILVSCSQRFTKFSETGVPVRATLNVRFEEVISPSKGAVGTPHNSPDTAKFKTLTQGDSLWSIATETYGDCGSWRLIADANKLGNPRLLNSGSMIHIPAIKK